jgi:hypothetical protein
MIVVAQQATYSANLETIHIHKNKVRPPQIPKKKKECSPKLMA